MTNVPGETFRSSDFFSSTSESAIKPKKNNIILKCSSHTTGTAQISINQDELVQYKFTVARWRCAYLAIEKYCRVRYIIMWKSAPDQWSCFPSLQSSTRSSQCMWEPNEHRKRHLVSECQQEASFYIFTEWLILVWSECDGTLTCAKRRLTVNKWGSLLNFLLKNMTAMVHTYQRKHWV